VLNDTNVTQTINPRELSEEDAAFWGSISRGSANVSHQSQRSPAINRSLSETKLHLRDQVITDVRSEEARYADYRLVRLLGKGGMGNVYVARQGSLDRLVALKVIKPLDDEKQRRLKQKGTLEQVEKERRLQFISEAVVTGDLDHPNIVPIHDIAVSGDDDAFLFDEAGQRHAVVQSDQEKSRDENIDILLKVCDAIGFAHTRGVVHRDIKPENIMLGEFGVVMVMDWGLALAKPEFEKIESVHPTTGLGGSPAYMAPEMATGPVDRIGPASDIYLLGATLFQIIAGAAPHHAANVSECLKAVASNKIREVPAEKQGELLQIALKAMATRPEDRYATVRDFQDAIRSYRSHSESIALAVKSPRGTDSRRDEFIL
jgi:serine/threonine protein kinase